jgi:hypothetical protein
MEEVEGVEAGGRPVTMRVKCMDKQCEVGVTVVRVPRDGGVLVLPAKYVCVKCLGEMKVLNRELRRAMEGGE